MPIKSASICEWEDSFWGVEWPSEELWKKFECDSPQESEEEEDEEWGSTAAGVMEVKKLGAAAAADWCGGGGGTPPPLALERKGPREIRLHDCMWAGVCLSKDHKPTRRVLVAVPRSSRSLLRPARPETPQSDDGGDDNCVSASEVTGQAPRRACGPAGGRRGGSGLVPSHDHDYQRKPAVAPPPSPQGMTPSHHPHIHHHQTTTTPDPSTTGARTTVTTDDLGVQTPSDSEEEEIDVVSVVGRSGGAGSVVVCGGAAAGAERVPPGVGGGLQQRLLSAASEAVSRRLRRPPTPAAKRKEPTPTPSEDDYDDPAPPPPTRPRKRPSPKKNSSRFSTDSETESTERRSLHNNMERMRRIDLRNAFEDLRSLVPNLASPRRAAKVNILRDAAAYCHELTSKSDTMAATVAALRKRQQRLRSDLSRLRRHLAANR